MELSFSFAELRFEIRKFGDLKIKLTCSDILAETPQIKSFNELLETLRNRRLQSARAFLLP